MKNTPSNPAGDTASDPTPALTKDDLCQVEKSVPSRPRPVLHLPRKPVSANKIAELQDKFRRK